MRRHNPHDILVVFGIKLRQRGYARSISGLWRIFKKISLIPIKPKNPKYIPKPYETMQYPGQRVQIAAKHIPSSCLVGNAKGEKLYQYTAIDEFSHFRYIEAFEEYSTYNFTQFLLHVKRAFPFPIECVQTENGFESTLKTLGIQHKKIHPFTPRHNGKVERSHRKDNKYFYALHHFSLFRIFLRN